MYIGYNLHRLEFGMKRLTRIYGKEIYKAE